MRSKNNKFVKEQYKLVSHIEDLLDLKNTPTHILHNLDNNDQIQFGIMNLAPEIRKYYNCNNLKAVTDPSRIKRPWLSIIKTLLKPYYHIKIEDYHFTLKMEESKQYIHTQKYTFTEIKNGNDFSFNELSMSIEDV